MDRLPVVMLDPVDLDAGSYAFEVEVVGAERRFILSEISLAATRWEVLVAGNPAEPVLRPDGLDYIYVEVPV